MTEKKVAIVTGGCGGIGFATARLFSENGYNVIVADANADASAWKELDRNMRPRLEDVSDLRQVEALFRYCKIEFGRLDALVLAHGVHTSMKCDDAVETDFDWVMEVNVKGTFFCCKEALNLMAEGSITMVGSSVGTAADSDAPIYSISKAAVHQLTKCLAQEYGRRVRVNCIAPGPVDTPLLRRAFGNDEAKMEEYRKMAPRGIAAPEEVARVIYMLATEPFFNGAIVPFDGGESIMYSGEPAK